MAPVKFVQMLLVRMREIKSCVCVGLDADASHEKVPARLKSIHGPITSYNLAMETARLTSSYACCWKINQGFFACHGPMGMTMLYALVPNLRNIKPNIPIILDYKREDIGNSAKQYAMEALAYGVDAVTVGSYLGSDSICEFITRVFPFVLCHTTNKSAEELQHLQVKYGNVETSLYLQVAKLIGEWDGCEGGCGAVLGATFPTQMREAVRFTGSAPVLIPGIGKQEGALKETISAVALSTVGERPFVINSSRGIMFADDPKAAACQLCHQINELLPDGFYG